MTYDSSKGRCSIKMAVFISALAFLQGRVFVWADSDMDHAAHHPSSSGSSSGPLAPLAAALDQNQMESGKKMKKSSRTSGQPAKAMGMGGMGGGMGMMGGMSGMAAKKLSETPAPPTNMATMTAPSRGVGAMVGMKGMQMMGSKGPAVSSGNNPTASEIPGVAGVSHLYHVGATDFFMDHPELITLTEDQQQALIGIKEKASLTQATFQRKIDQSEQDLWSLTSSDQPKGKDIEAKIKEIEAHRGEQRIAFIQAVAESEKVLSSDQRMVLLGQVMPRERTGGMTTMPTKASPSPVGMNPSDPAMGVKDANGGASSSAPKPAGMGGMGGGM